MRCRKKVLQSLKIRKSWSSRAAGYREIDNAGLWLPSVRPAIVIKKKKEGKERKIKEPGRLRNHVRHVVARKSARLLAILGSD